MPINLPDMIIPKYRTSQLPMLPLLPPVPRSDKFNNVKSRYMVPSNKSSIRVETGGIKQGWKNIYGS